MGHTKLMDGFVEFDAGHAGQHALVGVERRQFEAAVPEVQQHHDRGPELTAFYTDEGVLPRVARIELYEAVHQFGVAHQWSLHMLSGQAWAQLLLMLIAALFAFWLLIGYRTRLSAVACWILLLSLDARNPMILDSGDVLLRSMLFWALFLPLGARASVDSVLNPPDSSTSRACSAA